MASIRADLVASLIRLTFRNKVGRSKDIVKERVRFENSLFYKMASIGGVTPGTDESFGGVDCETINSDHCPHSCTLIYLHGGVFAFRSPSIHRNLASQIAQPLNAQTVMVDYRLAPEFPFPCAIEDVLTVYRLLLERGTRPGEIIIAGDSAGGGLTLSTLLGIRDQGLPSPACAICLSPWADLTQSGRSMYTRALADPMLSKDMLDWAAGMYLQDTDADHPWASPIFADLSGLPPLLIQVGTDEVLLDDARRVHSAAERDGVQSRLEVWDHMLHVWQATSLLPEAELAIQSMAEFVGKNVPAVREHVAPV